MSAQVIDFMVHLHAHRSIGAIQTSTQVAPVMAPVRIPIAPVSVQTIPNQSPSLRAALYIPKDATSLQRRTETPEGLEIWTWEGFNHASQRPAAFAIAIVGRANKALWYHAFRDGSAREKKIRDTIQSQEAKTSAKRERMAERKSFQHGLQIGDILYASWGYDQTNIDFYQVTKLYGKAIGLREIGSKLISSASGSNNVVANPDSFAGPEMKKIPQGSEKHVYVRIKNSQTAYKWDGSPVRETSAGWGH